MSRIFTTKEKEVNRQNCKQEDCTFTIQNPAKLKTWHNN